MKKFILTILLSFAALFAFADHYIYFPVYISNVEVYDNDSLVKSETVYGKSEFTLPTEQAKYCVQIKTADYNTCAKNFASLKQRLKWRDSGTELEENSLLYKFDGFTPENTYSSNDYLKNSYFYSHEFQDDPYITHYLEKNAKSTLFIPVTCNILNTYTNRTTSINTSKYCDEWSIVDGKYTYKIRMLAAVVRAKGYINEKGLAYIQNGNYTETLYYGPYLHYNFINTVSYEVLERDICQTEKEFRDFKHSNGYYRGYDK